MVIKIADFGLSVSTGAKNYYRLTTSSDMGIKLPVMWMAPESLSDYIFTEISDIVRDKPRTQAIPIFQGATLKNLIGVAWVQG